MDDHTNQVSNRAFPGAREPKLRAHCVLESGGRLRLILYCIRLVVDFIFLYASISPMLVIRLQRVGKKNDPSFRVVLVDSKRSAKTGRFLEVLGNYDARKGEPALKGERIAHWLSVGAQPSGTVHNILISAKLIDGKKINVLPKKSPPKKEEKPEEKKEVAEEVSEKVEEKTETIEEKVGLEEVKEEATEKTEEPKEEISVDKEDTVTA